MKTVLVLALALLVSSPALADGGGWEYAARVWPKITILKTRPATPADYQQRTRVPDAGSQPRWITPGDIAKVGVLWPR